MQTEKQKPIHEVRIGNVKAAVWKNETDKGPYYNVTFSRSYKDGEKWHSSDSFGRDELLTVAKAADLAHTWVFTQRQEDERKAKAARSQ